MRKQPTGAALANGLGHGDVMELLRLLHGGDGPAHHCDHAIVFPERCRDMETDKSLRRPPHNRVALAEDHRPAFLDLVIREEGIQAIRAGPYVHDQEFAGTFGWGM